MQDLRDKISEIRSEITDMGFQQRTVNVKNQAKKEKADELTSQINEKFEERDELKEEIDQLENRLAKQREEFGTSRPVAAEFKA